MDQYGNKKDVHPEDVDEWYRSGQTGPDPRGEPPSQWAEWVYSYDINEWVSRSKRTSNNSKFKI